MFEFTQSQSMNDCFMLNLYKLKIKNILRIPFFYLWPQIVTMITHNNLGANKTHEMTLKLVFRGLVFCVLPIRFRHFNYWYKANHWNKKRRVIIKSERTTISMELPLQSFNLTSSMIHHQIFNLKTLLERMNIQHGGVPNVIESQSVWTKTFNYVLRIICIQYQLYCSVEWNWSLGCCL